MALGALFRHAVLERVLSVAGMTGRRTSACSRCQSLCGKLLPRRPVWSPWTRRWHSWQGLVWGQASSDMRV